MGLPTMKQVNEAGITTSASRSRYIEPPVELLGGDCRYACGKMDYLPLDCLA